MLGPVPVPYQTVLHVGLFLEQAKGGRPQLHKPYRQTESCDISGISLITHSVINAADSCSTKTCDFSAAKSCDSFSVTHSSCDTSANSGSISPIKISSDSFSSPAPIACSTPLKRTRPFPSPSCSTPVKKAAVTDAGSQTSPAIKSTVEIQVQTSPAVKSVKSTVEIQVQTSPEVKGAAEVQVQTSPAVKTAYDVSIKECLQQPQGAPLNDAEQKLSTHFVKRQLNLSSDKVTVQCKTGGQPLILKKITRPRKASLNASAS